MPRAPGQLTRPGGYRRVHRPGFAYPQVYGSYYYSPVFGHGYGYNPYYYGYPRAYGSYFYFGGYPYTVGYGYPWIYDSAWGYGQTPYYGGYAGDYADYYQGSLRLKIKPGTRRCTSTATTSAWSIRSTASFSGCGWRRDRTASRSAIPNTGR